MPASGVASTGARSQGLRGRARRHAVRMRIPTYEESTATPLTTPVLIEERVRALIGRACRTQLWFLFLDENQVQLPVVMPIADLPADPNDSVHDLARFISHTVDELAARSVIVVIERYASSGLTDTDLAWARGLHSAFDGAAVELGGILLSHNRGVRWVAQDDYRY